MVGAAEQGALAATAGLGRARSVAPAMASGSIQAHRRHGAPADRGRALIPGPILPLGRATEVPGRLTRPCGLGPRRSSAALLLGEEAQDAVDVLRGVAELSPGVRAAGLRLGDPGLGPGGGVSDRAE